MLINIFERLIYLICEIIGPCFSGMQAYCRVSFDILLGEEDELVAAFAPRLHDIFAPIGHFCVYAWYEAEDSHLFV